jgi:quinate dehydrogenase (quinone)
LPLGAETTPMTCVSPISGRQFVVISAGSNLVAKDRGDYVVAFALPKYTGSGSLVSDAARSTA